MTVTIAKDILIDRLAKAVQFIPKKPIIPITDSVLCRVEKTKMDIVASDTQTQITISVPVDAAEPFAFCLPARLLLNTVRLFREEYVTITEKKNIIEIKSGKSKYKITLAAKPTDFPLMPVEKYTSEMNLAQSSLKKCFSITEQFINKKDAVESFHGIKIEEKGGKVIVTAPSRVVIARGEVAPLSLSSWAPITITPDTANKVCALLESKKAVHISNSGRKICFNIEGEEGDNIEVIATVLDVKAIDTEKFFEVFPPKTVKLHTIEVQDALKRIELYAKEDVMHATFTANIEASQIVIRGEDIDYGKEGEDIVTFEDKPVEMGITFSCPAILAVINNIEENHFNFFWTDYKGSVLITPVPETNKPEAFSFMIAVCIP